MNGSTAGELPIQLLLCSTVCTVLLTLLRMLAKHAAAVPLSAVLRQC
jgi:hypothetical protein